MENFTFYSPTYFMFGKDTQKEAGRLVHRFGGSKVIKFMTGPASALPVCGRKQAKKGAQRS